MDVLVNPPGEDRHPLRVDRVRDRIACANSNGISESRPQPIANGYGTCTRGGHQRCPQRAVIVQRCGRKLT